MFLEVCMEEVCCSKDSSHSGSSWPRWVCWDSFSLRHDSLQICVPVLLLLLGRAKGRPFSGKDWNITTHPWRSLGALMTNIVVPQSRKIALSDRSRALKSC